MVLGDLLFRLVQVQYLQIYSTSDINETIQNTEIYNSICDLQLRICHATIWQLFVAEMIIIMSVSLPNI